MKKLPPIEKIYEAYSAIADKRITLFNKKAQVKSSDRKKIYTILWQNNTYSSNDNATYWQGYPGYPIIAVLMLQKKLPLNIAEANLLKNVNWNQLNKEFKRNYAKAVNYIIRARNLNKNTLNKSVKQVYRQIENLNLEIKRGKSHPAK